MVGPGQGLLQPTRVLALQPAGSELQIPGLTASAGCHSDGRESSRGEPHPGVPTETLSGTGIPASRWQNLGLDLDTVAAGARLTQTSGEQMWWGGVGKARLETGRGAGCPGLVGTELRGGGAAARMARAQRTLGRGPRQSQEEGCGGSGSGPPPGCPLSPDSSPGKGGAWSPGKPQPGQASAWGLSVVAPRLEASPPARVLCHGHRACGHVASIHAPELMRRGCGRSRQQQPNVLTR